MTSRETVAFVFLEYDPNSLAFASIRPFLLISEVSLLDAQMSEIRLSGGFDNEGRLEVFHNEAWGTVCSIMGPSTKPTRDRLCEFLGFVNGSSGFVQHGNYFGLPESPMNIELDIGAMRCAEDATSILDCGPLDWGHTICSHGEDFILKCERNYTREDIPGREGDVRLVGGPDNSTGRVERYGDGAWRSQCTRSTMGYDEAEDFCHGANYTRAVTYWRRSPWGPGQGLSNLHDCSHALDFSIQCTDDAETAQDGDLRLVDGTKEGEGRVEVFFGGYWGTMCSDNIYVHQAEILCSMLGFNDVAKYFNQNPFGEGSGDTYQTSVECPGTNGTNEECEIRLLGTACHHEDDLALECGGAETGRDNEFRLVGGTDEAEGRVEIFMQGEWGSVCGDMIMDSAHMICRSLGYDGAVWYHGNAFFGFGSGPIWVSELDCPPGAVSYGNCSASHARQSCTHEHDMSIRCGTPETGEEMGMRLAGSRNETVGSSGTEGRVEVFHNGEWGSVCNAMFGMNEANIICLYLGHGGANGYFHGPFFGPGHNRVWMQGLECVEGGSDLVDDCQWSWEPLYCHGGSDRSAGVSCYPANGDGGSSEEDGAQAAGDEEA